MAAIQNLNLYETYDLIPLADRSVSDEQRVISAGNSILSTLFVSQIDAGATLKVNWWDYGVGSEEGERVDLDSHALVTDAVTLPYSDRIDVTRLHNRAVLEWILTGGSVRFGVYVTVVSAFASDLDSALVKDGQTADLARDKGLQITTYDPVLNKFFFLRSSGGVINTSGYRGVENNLTSGLATTDPGVLTDFITYTVPAGKKLWIHNMKATCRVETQFTTFIDSVLIGGCRTGNAQATAGNIMVVPRVATEGQVVTVKGLTRSPSVAQPLECFLDCSLEDVVV